MLSEVNEFLFFQKLLIVPHFTVSNFADHAYAHINNSHGVTGEKFLVTRAKLSTFGKSFTNL